MAPPPPVSPQFGDQRFAYPSPPKWSVIAIVGFVVSFLLILAPLGILLGIVGITLTRGGRRRGMGLSIAAIPIGLIVGVVSWLLVFSAIVFAVTLREAQKATDVLRVSQVNVAERSAEFYGQFARRFQLAVSSEQFESWLTAVISKHGTLQNVKMAKQRFEQTPTGEWRISFTGQFVNGTANIAVTLTQSGGFHAQVIDISVEGLSAIAGAAPPDPP